MNGEPKTKAEKMAHAIAGRFAVIRGAMPGNDKLFADLNWRAFTDHGEAVVQAIHALDQRTLAHKVDIMFLPSVRAGIGGIADGDTPTQRADRQKIIALVLRVIVDELATEFEPRKE